MMGWRPGCPLNSVELNLRAGSLHMYYPFLHKTLLIVPTELFLSVAAHLAHRTWDIKYLNWAVKEGSGLSNLD
jgi:hypothetical protein